MADINFVGLGGMTEIGMKLYVLEIKQDIYIFDSGMKYPEDIMFGIDKVIPDMTYIRNNRKRVKAVFLSNISDNNIGSLSMLMDIIDTPIYGSPFTLSIAKQIVRKKNQQFIALQQEKTEKIGQLQVTAFAMTYSVPGNFGYLIETPFGNLVYISDYVFNQNVPKSYLPDLGYLGALKNKNVLALISPTKGAETIGYGANNPQFSKQITYYIKNMKGSLFLNIFTKNLLDIQLTIAAAQEANKKICILGRRGYEIISADLKNMGLKRDTLVTFKNLKQVDRDKVIYLVLGDEGVPYDLMLHILSDAHREVRVQPNDTVLLAVPKVPGSELKVSALIDAAFQKNMETAMIDFRDVMADTAGLEDMKLLQNFIDPKYLIVTDGEYRQIVEFEKQFNTSSGQDANVRIADSGEWISFQKGKPVKSEQTALSLDEVLINGELFEDSDNYILKEREQLSSDGAVILTVALLEENNTYISQYVNYQSLGFIPEAEQRALIREIKTDVMAVVEASNSAKHTKINDLKRQIQETINQTIYRELKRYPIVVVQFIMQKK
jgi:ribonuclease J